MQGDIANIIEGDMGMTHVWLSGVRVFGIYTCVRILATLPTSLVATGKSLRALENQFPHL